MAAGDYTVRDLIQDALLEIGVMGVADPNDPDVFALALRRTIAMYASFQAQRLLLYAVARTVYPLTAGEQTRTIGPSGATFTAPRPLWVAHAGIIPDNDDIEIPLHVYTRQEWFAEPLKNLTDLYPRAVLYEPTSTVLGTFTFWPIPTTAPDFAFSTPVALQTITDLDTVLLFAPGYQEAWIYNLAKRLARPFKKRVTPDLFADAKESLGIIKRLNDEAPPPSRSDAALTGAGGFDIRSNSWRSY